MRTKFSDCVNWRGKLDPSTYLLLGVALFLLKFALDCAVCTYVFGQPWPIWAYLNPGMVFSPEFDGGLALTLLALSLPFLCLGVLLTVQRLRSSGLPVWLVVIFVIPVVKLVLFAILCVTPSRTPADEKPKQADGPPPLGVIRKSENAPMSAIFGIAAAVVIALFTTWLGTSVFRDYGWSLFIGAPFCMGFVAAMIYSLPRRRTLKQNIGVALLGVLFAGAGLLLAASEGAICLLMAAPLAAVLAVAGAMVAHLVQAECRWRNDSSKLFCCVFLAVPFSMGLEHIQRPPAPLFSVTTSVVVNASPEKVWQNVVSFSELPPPTELLFRAGIAYPIRAEIKGQGRGAVRYCQFCTGPFVEPIEVWNEPHLLRFSVTDNPAPMREMSPYADLHPPHLDGFLVSRQGQFQLTRLPDGRTLLEGTTWYQHHLWPAAYWRVWSDYIIHRIHLRVLNHVKQLSEQGDALISNSAHPLNAIAP